MKLNDRMKNYFLALLRAVLVVAMVANGGLSSAAGNASKKERDLSRRMDRESFYEELKNEMEKSLQKVQYSRVEKAVRLENELAKSQDPWTISNNIKWTNYNTNPRLQETTDTLTLKYENQNGFSFQVYGDAYTSSPFPNSGRYSKGNYGASLTQDIMSWFRKTSFELNQEITELSGKSKLISNEATYLSTTLKLVDWSYQLFSALCKRKDLDRILKMAQETLKTSEVQQAARTISMRDLIRIRSTYIGVQRQISSADYEIQSAQNQFATLSPGSYEKAKSLSSGSLFCEDDLEKLKSAGYPSKQEIQAIVAKHPTILSLDLSKENLKKKFELYKTSRAVKVSLSAGWDKTNNTNGVAPTDQGFVGLAITYQFQGDYYNSYKQQVAEQFQDISVQQKIAQQELAQYLGSIFDQIEFQKSQIPVVATMIDNAEKLIKIIETQQSIGQLDATAIEAAVQGQIGAQSEKRTLWSQISSNALKITEIKKASEKATTLR